MKKMPAWIALGLFSSFAMGGTAEQPTATEDVEQELRFLKAEAYVETASKKKEKLNEAPGIIGIITAEEIARYGATNLHEILNRATSVYALGSHLYVDNAISIRGDRSTHIDSHVLILINGRPSRENLVGGINNAIYKAFPINQIERLEIIRGPGSVLYGTNAYSGVINIITKKGEENYADASAGYDTYAGYRFTADGSKKIDGVEVSGGAQFYRNRGWNFKATDENGITDHVNYDQENIGAYSRVKYGNLTFNGFVARSQHQHMGTTAVWPPQPRPIEVLRGFADLGYEAELTNIWKTNVNLTYNFFYDNFTNYLGASYPGQNKSPLTSGTTSSLLFENTHFVRVNDEIDVTVGGLVDYQTGYHDLQGLPDTVPKYSRFIGSLYGQISYALMENIKLFAGGQLNKSPNIDLNFVKRFGLIYQINDALGTKFLYSEAYRSPNPTELFFNAPNSLIGNPNLTPEKVGTWDAQLFSNFKDINLQASITYFYTRQMDLIARIKTGSGALSYINGGIHEFQGVEVEGKWSPLESLFANFSYTFQENHNDKGVDNATLMPQHMAKVGLSYSLMDDLVLSVFDTYFSRAPSVAIVNPQVKNFNPMPRAYHDLSVKLAYLIKPLNAEVSVYGANLLNEDIYYPEINRKIINAVPGKGGTSFLFEVKAGF